jgi:hypothetical protein
VAPPGRIVRSNTKGCANHAEVGELHGSALRPLFSISALTRIALTRPRRPERWFGTAAKTQNDSMSERPGVCKPKLLGSHGCALICHEQPHEISAPRLETCPPARRVRLGRCHLRLVGRRLAVNSPARGASALPIGPQGVQCQRAPVVEIDEVLPGCHGPFEEPLGSSHLDGGEQIGGHPPGELVHHARVALAELLQRSSLALDPAPVAVGGNPAAARYRLSAAQRAPPVPSLYLRSRSQLAV